MSWQERILYTIKRPLVRTYILGEGYSGYSSES